MKLEKSAIFTYDIEPLTDLRTLESNKLATLQDILEDYTIYHESLENVCYSIVCWIEAWQKARNTKDCAENSLVAQTTDFIEYLYSLLIGSQNRIIGKVKGEIKKIHSDN